MGVPQQECRHWAGMALLHLLGASTNVVEIHKRQTRFFAGNLPRQLIRERDWLPFAKAEARRRASVGAARKL